MLYAPMNDTHAASSQMLGVTLVELLISMLLGTLLAMGIVKVYLEHMRAFVVEEDLSRIQENGRFALNLLSRELMQAGLFGGHLSAGKIAPVNLARDCSAIGPWALKLETPIEHISDFSGSLLTGSGTSFTCVNPSKVQPGTDIFSVKRTANVATLRDGVYQSSPRKTQWYLRFRDYGATNEWLYNNTSGFPAVDVGTGSKTDYWEFYSKVFYLRKYATTPSDNVPTLCVAMLAGKGMSSECLIEGIEDMQLDFGVDIDGDGVANQFLRDPNAPQIADAVSARISLLLRGVNPIVGYTNQKSFRLGAKQVPAKNDAFLRRVMTTTVQLRNVVNVGV
ncbi:MAG: PilW family protein [Halioglobus sp.]